MGIITTLKEKLPGLRTEPGHRLRNLIVGAGYVFLLLTLITAAMGGGDVENTGSDGEGAATNPDETEPAPDDDTNETSSDTDDAGDSEPAEAANETTEGDAEQAAQEAEEPVAAAEDTVDERGPAAMEQVASEQGIDINVHENAEGNLEADYFSTAANEEELAEDIGFIAGSYAGVVDAGHESDHLTITVRTNAGEPIGEYRVSADDAQAYANGDITGEEFMLRVLASGEVYE